MGAPSGCEYMRPTCVTAFAKAKLRNEGEMLIGLSLSGVAGDVENEKGAFFRLETTNRSPAKATTGGTLRWKEPRS